MKVETCLLSMEFTHVREREREEVIIPHD